MTKSIRYKTSEGKEYAKAKEFRPLKYEQATAWHGMWYLCTFQCHGKRMEPSPIHCCQKMLRLFWESNTFYCLKEKKTIQKMIKIAQEKECQKKNVSFLDILKTRHGRGTIRGWVGTGGAPGFEFQHVKGSERIWKDLKGSERIEEASKMAMSRNVKTYLVLHDFACQYAKQKGRTRTVREQVQEPSISVAVPALFPKNGWRILDSRSCMLHSN